MSKKTPFEKLKAEWNKKLKDSGFVDIEKDGRLIELHSHRFNREKHKYSFGGWEAKQEYYRLAEMFCNTYKFKTELDHVIWEYHTNGIGAPEISKILYKAKVAKMSQATVWLVIKRLEHEMKKMYLRGYKEKHDV